jgi:hypothetical protein
MLGGIVLPVPSGLTGREVRVTCSQYFQPSLVFYCRREVHQLGTEAEVLSFLDYPLPVYLFVLAARWEALESQVHGPTVWWRGAGIFTRTATSWSSRTGEPLAF